MHCVFIFFHSTSTLLVLWMSTWKKFFCVGFQLWQWNIIFVEITNSYINLLYMYFPKIHRSTVMSARALTLHWHTDMNTLKCIILSAVKHRPTENALRPLTWSICGGPSTGFMRFGWGCQGNGTGWIHGQLMAEMERNLYAQPAISYIESIRQKWSKE